jgi:heme-degrading monooxygenase HmoA
MASDSDAQGRENHMIARTWHATAATAENADAYCQHFATEVVPRLKAIRGHRGALLLRRSAGRQVEFVAITLWDSIETVKEFAGPNPEIAIVEPQARAVLTQFDTLVTHYEVASGSTLDCDISGSASSAAIR